MRFSVASNRVSLIVGSTIFMGTPGNPAPLPTSTTLAFLKSAYFKRAIESIKCVRATYSAPDIAVKLKFFLL